MMNTPKPEKQKRPRRAKEHYVNNKEFSQAVVDYVNSVNKAREDDTFEPNITSYIGTCFLKISEGLSHKPNFYSYTYREEMVMDAVENPHDSSRAMGISYVASVGKHLREPL